MQTEGLLKHMTWYNKENNCSTWNYSKTKEQTKIKLYYPFALIILDKGTE